MQQTSKAPTFVNMNQLMPEYTCPRCGKKFVLPICTDLECYAYKLMAGRQIQYYDCYTCFRAAQKEKDERRAKQKEKTKIKMSEVMRKMSVARWEKIRSERNESAKGEFK